MCATPPELVYEQQRWEEDLDKKIAEIEETLRKEQEEKRKAYNPSRRANAKSAGLSASQRSESKE